ncbi:MAG: hypothetical protein ACT4P4_00805 [Betaproteobacteria bacterium]
MAEKCGPATGPSPGVPETGDEALEALALNWPREDRPKNARGFIEDPGLLSAEHYRVLNNAERGVLHAARLACWQSGTIPNDPLTLTAVLGPSVEDGFTDRVRARFRTCKANPERLHYPELTAYMLELMHKAKIAKVTGSAGGKKSAKARKAQRR